MCCAGWDAKQNRLFLKRLWGWTFFDWLQRGALDKTTESEGLLGNEAFSAQTLIGKSLYLIGEPYTAMTLATMMENETESNSNDYIFHYTKQQPTKQWFAVWTRGGGSFRKYHLLRLYNDLYGLIYNTATIMITIRHLGKIKKTWWN